jgi:hypothetical protein
VGLDRTGMIASELGTIGIDPEADMMVETPDAAAAMVSKSVMAARTRF